MNADVALIQRVLSGALALPVAFDASPIACALGMELMSLSHDEAVVGFTPQETFLQGAGVLQGGAVAAMLDYAMILAVMASMPAGAAPATTNLDLVCLRPATLGNYRAVARTRRRTRSVMFTEADLRLPDGTDIATARATNVIRPAGLGSPGALRNDSDV